MAKLIKITDKELERIKQEFAEAISELKMSDGKINYSKTVGTVDRKADLVFSEIAWIKMQMLISEFDKEVAWHGVAHREDGEEKDSYVVTDILVYPQEVTGATVNTDQERYQDWLYEHDDDVFNNIRLQGHSHVNMSTTPSSVDNSLYERILDQLDDDMFYIFVIWNKRGDSTIKIYDMEKNVLFETADVDVLIEDGEAGFNKFLIDAEEMVKEKKTTVVRSTTQTGTQKSSATTTKSTKKKGKRASSGYYDDCWYDRYGISGYEDNGWRGNYGY